MAKPEDIINTAEAELDGNQLLTVKLARKDGETVLYVQADEKITDLIQTGHERTSDSWGTEYTDDDNGYSFFKKSGYTDQIQSMAGKYQDSYGGSFYNHGGNIAVLRTKGIEDGKFFRIDEPLTKENLRNIQKSIKKFGDELIDKFLKDVAFVSEVREVEAENTVQTGFGGD